MVSVGVDQVFFFVVNSTKPTDVMSPKLQMGISTVHVTLPLHQGYKVLNRR